ncbi:DNA ligase-1 [Evansella vedderi]|uniref:DNA ligase-1 n=1 Tax=Evansella vedderi TaxID=38282 RepID=A0ABT9ZX14_9BACI|nr:ATP-dependent DNA ligase [Evansella vedderi]MDQ0255500.1 DNA ligase-1 [Evansella vedderi]
MFISPMLMTEKEPFTHPEYLYEPKFDGFRLIVVQINGEITLYTRHGTNVTEKFKELLTPICDYDFVADGELIALNDNGMDQFNLVMSRFHSNPYKYHFNQNSIKCQAVLFDLLMFDHRDLTPLPLLERKDLLKRHIKETPHVKRMSFVLERGEDLFKAVQSKNMEGCVAKRIDSKYEVNKRTKTAWFKNIAWNYNDSDIYISGFRNKEFGWFISQKEGDKFRPVGTIEFGPSPEEKKAFYSTAKQLIVKEYKDKVIIEPVIRAKIKHRNTVPGQMLRTPIFLEFVL